MENPKEVQRRWFKNVFTGGVKSGFGVAAWPGSRVELTRAFCSLYSFALGSLEGSSHGSFSLNNDINGACRKEDLCGISFPCAA